MMGDSMWDNWDVEAFNRYNGDEEFNEDYDEEKKGEEE